MRSGTVMGGLCSQKKTLPAQYSGQICWNGDPRQPKSTQIRDWTNRILAATLFQAASLGGRVKKSASNCMMSKHIEENCYDNVITI
jgi:hypothetical protein